MLGMVSSQGGEDYSGLRAEDYRGGIKDDGSGGAVRDVNMVPGMQHQQHMTFIPNATSQSETDPSMVVERFLTCRKCGSTDMIFRKLYHPDPPLEIYACAHCSQQIALCRVCGAQMNAVGGHLRRHMQRHEKAMMQNSMGFAMIDKNAVIKVEPAKVGQGGSPGMQNATMFTLPGGQEGVSIEGLAVGGKEAPVRVAPGRACMRCAYIKMRCDGNRPCERCLRTGHECTDQVPPLYGGPGARKASAAAAAAAVAGGVPGGMGIGTGEWAGASLSPGGLLQRRLKRPLDGDAVGGAGLFRAGAGVPGTPGGMLGPGGLPLMGSGSGVPGGGGAVGVEGLGGAPGGLGMFGSRDELYGGYSQEASDDPALINRCRICKQEGELAACEAPGCRSQFHLACAYPPHGERPGTAGGGTGPLLCPRCEERSRSAAAAAALAASAATCTVRKSEIGFPAGFGAYLRFQQYRSPFSRAAAIQRSAGTAALQILGCSAEALAAGGVALGGPSNPSAVSVGLAGGAMRLVNGVPAVAAVALSVPPRQSEGSIVSGLPLLRGGGPDARIRAKTEGGPDGGQSGGAGGPWCSLCNRSFKSQHALDVHVWVSVAHREHAAVATSGPYGGISPAAAGPATPSSTLLGGALLAAAGAAGLGPGGAMLGRRTGSGRVNAMTLREGASMRAKVCSVAEDAGVLVQTIVSGRPFFGMLREVLPADATSTANDPTSAAAGGWTGRRRTQPRVVVVGAGMSGLAAAEELHALGCKVVVLEARNRLGGRCWTLEPDDLGAPPAPPPPCEGLESSDKQSLVGRCVDLGAAWIHGIVDNPLAELARQQGLDLFVPPSDVALFGGDGQPPGPDEEQEAERFFNDLLCQARDASASITFAASTTAAATGTSPAAAVSASDEPLGQVLERTLVSMQQASLAAATSAAGGGINSAIYFPQTPLQRQLLGWHLACVEHSNGAGAHQLSARHWAMDDGDGHYDGPQGMPRPGGMAALARALAQPLDEIRFNAEVAVIRHHQPLDDLSSAAAASGGDAATSGTAASSSGGSAGGSCSVVLRDGSEIEADMVLVTLPLGVLKARDVRFDPELPAWKLEAIDRIGCGLLNKVVLAFDRAFWSPALPPRGRFLGWAAPGPEDREPGAGDAGGLSWPWFFSDLTEASGGRPTLAALAAGHAAHEMEGKDDGAVVAEAMAALRRILQDVDNPTGFKVTRWGRDPFARGACAFVPVGCGL